MTVVGTYYSINEKSVTPPDVETWSDIVIGQGLDGLQRLSPYKRLVWVRRVEDACGEDWFEHHNTELTELRTRPPGGINETETYTEAYCLSVTSTQQHGTHTDITATFLVRVD